MTDIALDAIRDDHYRLGDFQAIRYDRSNEDLFPEGFLGDLYFMSKASRRRNGNGVLDALFGGNPASNYDAIVSYLANHQLIVIGEWIDGVFTPGGYAFIAIVCGTGDTERSAFCGYTIFKPYWGREEGRILAIVGITALFQEYGLIALHGIRYGENALTKRFTEQFGFRQVGAIPHYHLKNGKLVTGYVSSLSRVDFESYLEKFLIDYYKALTAEEPNQGADPAISR